MTPFSELYRHEAQRLYALAGALPLGQQRNDFIDIARQYEALARHAEMMERRTTTELPEGDAPLAPIIWVPER